MSIHSSHQTICVETVTVAAVTTNETAEVKPCR